MGASQSTGRNALQLAIDNLKRRSIDGQLVEGGAEGGFFGGDDEKDPAKQLRIYEESYAAAAKEDVIRRIGTALSNSGISLQSDTIDGIVATLQKELKGLRTGSSTFSADAKSQEKICNVIAGALNAQFTPSASKPSDKFIDTSLGPVGVCRAVSEWVHSFSSGVNTEFLAVHASVRNLLKRSEIYGEVTEKLYNDILQKVDEEGSSEVKRDIAAFDEIYRRARAANAREQETLKNILHVTLAPAAKELELAMMDESESNALVKKLGLKPGTSEFANSLAAAVSGLGTAASIAHRVHTALKAVGVSVNDYLTSSDYTAFSDELTKKLYTKDDPKEIVKFMEAQKVLLDSFAGRDNPQFQDALKSAKGGAATDEIEEPSNVDKRVKKQRLERKLIIKNFVEKTVVDYDQILHALKELSDKVGGPGFPVNDRTDALREAIRRFGDLHKDRVELALIGFYNDAGSRERKESFIASARMLIRAVDDLQGLEAYRGVTNNLSQLKISLENLIKTVDFYSDLVQKKYGGDAESKEGGADGPLDLSQYLPEVSRSGLSLAEATNTFVYKYYIAKVRRNLAQTSKELDSYGEDYTTILGDAVASRLKTIGIEKGKAFNVLTANSKAAATAAVGTANVKAAKEAADARESFLKGVYNTKTKFYKALQAIDLYMKVFTQSIATDPDAVRDIKRILDGLQVIARWFSKTSGDKLAEAFEFGDIYADGVRGNQSDVNSIEGDGHYYQRVGVAYGVTGPSVAGITFKGAPAATPDPGVGDPTYAFKMDGDAASRVKSIQQSVSDVYDNFQALKNLVNAFARIGDKFGGKEIRNQIFMSPTQIFKALTDYLKTSALSMSFLLGPEDGTPNEAGPGALKVSDQMTAIGGTSRVATGATHAFNHYDWEVYFGSVDPAAPGNFVFEDKYFSFIVKAMAAKVLTVVGVFDMFERPKPIYDITPVRMIVGGAPEERPSIVEGAMELYFRLPRLVEYYRSLFSPGMYESKNAPIKSIAMLPEVEGVFTGIIRLIFQRAQTSADSGDYSDLELNQMVREINAIYEHFHGKGGVSATTEAITAFIREINRRYGIVKSSEIDKYWEYVKDARADASYGKYNDTSYAILPDEGKDIPDRQAPSDRYMTPAAGTAPKFSSKYTVEDPAAAGSNFELISNLRNTIEKQFAKVNSEKRFNSASYSSYIKQSQLELKRAGSEAEKWNIAQRLIQSGNTSSIDPTRALMFHETVVAGLNVLGAVHTLLNEFSTRVQYLDTADIRKKILAALTDGVHTRGGVHPFASDEVDSQAKLVTNVLGGIPAYNAYIVSGEHGNTTGSRPFGELANGFGRTNTDATTQNLYQMANNGHLIGVGDGNKKSREVFARYAINYQNAMRDLMVSLFQISASFEGLVDVRFPGSQSSSLQVDFGSLRGAVETLMADVKSRIDMFRPYMSKETIARYESNVNAKGSVYWLEENLMDKFIRGKPSMASNATENKDTLDNLSRKLSGAFADMTQDFKFSWAGITTAHLQGAAGAAWTAAAGDHTDREPYGQVFASLIFYDATQADSGFNLAQTTSYNSQWELGGLIRQAQKPVPTDIGTAKEASLAGTVPWSTAQAAAVVAAGTGALTNTAARDATDAMRRYTFWTNDIGMGANRSIMAKYNQLIAQYLAVCMDAPTGRTYLNLVNGFANGTASASVMNALSGGSFPDLADDGITFGRRADPKPNAVLFTSLALALQRIIRDVNPTTQVSDHLVSSLIDVPLYMKETLRGALPGYAKLFNLIIRESELYKQVMQKTDISLWRPALNGALTGPMGGGGMQIKGSGGTGVYAASPAGTLAALESFSGEVTSAVTKQKFATLLDSISGGSYSLADSCTQVLKELGDSGVFLETNEGSIQSYKARYGKEPLMPLTLAMWAMRNLDDEGAKNMMMPRPTGGPAAEFQYGTRHLLTKTGKLEYDHVPGVKSVLDMYNGLAASRERISESDHLEKTANLVTLLRFVVDTHKYSTMMSTQGRGPAAAAAAGGPTSVPGLAAAVAAGGQQFFAEVDLTGADTPIRLANGGTALDPRYRNAVFSLASEAGTARTASDIIEVVKSSDQEGQIIKIATSVSDEPASRDSRDVERILNIIDLNVIPINVHALMRDVPLVNTYNYVYTFEQMAASMYNQQAANIRTLTAADTLSARQMLLRMLFDPYMQISEDNRLKEYGSDLYDLGSAGFIHRIFRGDNAAGLGRPKFLSDQMFGKALFGNLYTGSDFDEAGVTASIATSRGTDMSAYHALYAQNTALVPLVADANLGQLSAVISAIEVYRLILSANAFGGESAESVLKKTIRATANVIGLLTRIRPRGLQGGMLVAELRARIIEATASLAQLQAIVVQVATALGRNVGPIAGAAVPATVPAAAIALAANPGDQALRTALVTEFGGGGNNVGLEAQLVGFVTANSPESVALAAAGVPGANLSAQLLAFADGTGLFAWRPALVAATAGGAGTITGVADAIERLGPNPQRPSQADMARRSNANPRNLALTYSTGKISPEGTDPASHIKSVVVSAARREHLEEVGFNRFNTRLSRNLFFITNVLRLVRQQLNRSLTQNRSVILSSHDAVRPSLMEYGQDPYGPHEQLSDRDGTWADEESFR